MSSKVVLVTGGTGKLIQIQEVNLYDVIYFVGLVGKALQTVIESGDACAGESWHFVGSKEGNLW